MKKALLFFACCLCLLQSYALLTPQVDSIPMSDGRKLAADIYIPQGMSQGPVILIQTPYNRQLYRYSLPLMVGTNLNSSNYIFVIVDWRGFYGSAAAAYSGAPALGADGYSCVEWIAQQSWSNGKVGTWGPSALGRVQFQTAAKNPPHLTCICPLVAAPQYDYMEYFPNGCLRTEYVEQLGALGFGLTPFLMTNTLYNLTWSYTEAHTYYPDSIRVPCYMIGGWYDHTIDFMLPFFSGLQTQSPANVRGQHRLLMGPWVHGGHGTANVGSGTAGQLSYANSAYWADSLALRFFDYHLRNVNNNWDQSPAVQYYQMGDNTWNSGTNWPVSGASVTNFYLHADGSLSTLPPASATDSVSFNYDPLDPSPTVGGPTLRNDLQQGPYDQAPLVESRNDVVSFTTPALAHNAVLRGNAVVQLKVSSNRLDTDFDVRLTDVYPDGRSMLVNDGVVRMRFRSGLTAADTANMQPGQVYPVVITLPATALTFLAGHKIRLDVSSSNYPRFNRNMNTGGPMYPGYSVDSLVNPLVATNTIYTNTAQLSFLQLQLVDFLDDVKEIPAGDIWQIFPNPVHNQLNVQFKQSVNDYMYLYDATGRLVVKQPVEGSSAVINTAELANGTYLLQCSINKQRYTKQVAVVHP